MVSFAKLKRAFGARTSLPPAKGCEDVSSGAPRDRFFAAARQLGSEARVLEFGTKQSVGGRSTHAHGGMPNIRRENYVMADIEAGDDVDVVADIHALPADWTARFDAVVASAVFEHLERPWIAAKEIQRVLSDDGICYIATHQTFPLHGYPSDFFRFSKEALSLICTDAGLHVTEAAYEHRTRIVPPPAIVAADILDRWNEHCPSFLHVHVFAEKITSPSGTALERGQGLATR